MKIFIIISLLVIAFIVISRVYNAYFSESVAGGISNGQLLACPDKPNCVNSRGDASSPPFDLNEFDNQDWSSFIEKVSQLKEAKLIKKDDSYAHFEFTTAIMGYIDDVEFLYHPEERKIDFRSASRVGHSDLGKNRKRMESLRKIFSRKHP